LPGFRRAFVKHVPWASLLALVMTAAAATSARAQRSVILVRHAEKETDAAKVTDLDDLKIPLSCAGKTRADALAFLLKDAGVTSIYIAPAVRTPPTLAVRTQATARPLASQLMITPRILDDDALNHLAEREREGIVLIVGHSNTVPDVIDKILGRKSGVTIGEEEYDRLFVLFRKDVGSFGLVRSRY
jgi:phosphohistidine phosphatase SixA